MERVKIPDRPAGIICEKCGAEMVYKSGRFGEFIACPNYPACKNTKAVKTTIKTPCPLCGGAVVQKKTKKGKIFYGCENYPSCTFVSWDMPLEEKCPVCGAYMVMKKGPRRGEKVLEPGLRNKSEQGEKGMTDVYVIGAGLAGCEAAYQLTKKGVAVRLCEMKPQKYSPAHKYEGFAELVCSNSLRADRLETQWAC